MPLSQKTADRPVRPAHETDHLVPHANRLLVGAGKGAWWMVRLLAGIAIRIPGWFVRTNRRHVSGQKKSL